MRQQSLAVFSHLRTAEHHVANGLLHVSVECQVSDDHQNFALLGYKSTTVFTFKVNYGTFTF